MTALIKKTDYLRQGRQDRRIRELDHDPYHSKRKISGPVVCPACGAVYRRGRWTWEAVSAEAKEHTCPGLSPHQRRRARRVSNASR